MSCTENNPCDPCSQYDNCGCINPTSFDCVDTPGVCEASGITADMNGKQALAQICTAIADLQDDKGKVAIDSDDTCPEYLEDKLVAGLNITLETSGTGCDRIITINASEGGVPVDVKIKVSSDDTTNGYLDDKLTTGTYLSKSINNPAGNENLEIDVVPATLISTDAGNPLYLGTDGAIMSTCITPDGSETSLVAGTGVTITGSGTLADPYVASINPSISVVRGCFDGIWRNVSLSGIANPSVVYVSGNPQYRYRYDGTLEFKGSATYNIAFGAYSGASRQHTVTVATIPTTCLTSGEQAGTADLKSINYIDAPGVGVDQITQQYGYIIRKTTANLIVVFQSSFQSATSKTMVINFEGAVSHPTI